MSIFEAKEWWSASISNNEEFDSNSIVIDNIDNETPSKNKICVSSFNGFLRVFEPTFGAYRVENLLFEKYYDNPILQISTGNFLINSSDRQLAILQGKRLIVVQLYNLRGSASTKTCYEHKLVRNGFNFCLGRIGEKNYDVIIVQSIDGVICIYEQDSLVNSVSMSEIIFPGPMSFLSRKDYFVISNTAYEVECYSYNNLATVTSKSDDKKIAHAWVANIGELVRDLKVIDNKLTKKQEIIVLSETMLSVLDDNGKFMFQKKLDFEPMAIHAYNIEDPNYSQNKQINCMYMISTSSDHILVYKGLNLSWAVKIFDTAVFVKTCELEGMKGLVVTLSDSGRLTVLYLGMEPARNNRMIMPSKNMDPNVIASETDRLLNIVQNYEKGVVVIPDETLQINVDVDPNIHLDEDIYDDKVYYADHSGRILRAHVDISLTFDGEGAENVHISIVSPYNVICDEPSFTLSKLSQSESPFKKGINFRVFASLFPNFTSVKLYATYTIKNPDNREKSIQSTALEFELPLSLFLRTTNITKDAKNKITLCTDKDPLSVPKMFADLTENFADSAHVSSNQNMIGFFYPNRAEVSIIVSKNAGRYRIQSSHYEALLFITHQIITRLNEHFKYEVDIYIEDDIGLDMYYPIIETHFKLNTMKKIKNEELEKYTSLNTIIQKSLLNKYKEKNPPNLNNLDYLLKNVYKSINKQADEIIKIANEIKLNLRDLIIWTESVLYLLKLRSKMSDEHYQIVKDTFPLDNANGNENSWEDLTFTNMTNLFKYYFSNDKTNLQEVKEIKDLEKWKKYFKTLHDRLINNKGL